MHDEKVSLATLELWDQYWIRKSKTEILVATVTPITLEDHQRDNDLRTKFITSEAASNFKQGNSVSLNAKYVDVNMRTREFPKIHPFS